jgi:tryptophan synthase alpha chain
MGKEKIAARFSEKLADGKNLFVPYIVAGDGGLDILEERIQFLDDCGVAAIELGIPFSDPVADGPTIQEAGLRALENGVTLRKILDKLAPSKSTRNVPIILMTYINPIYAIGVEEFAAKCAQVGVDGVIIPDVPMEEEDLVAGALAYHDIAFIRLAALTSTPGRLEEIASRSEGFLYAVAVAGTTGARAVHEDRVYQFLADLKSQCGVPVLAGFGVSSPEQANRLTAHCDGVIVGSKIVDLLHQGRDAEVRELIESSL